MIEVHVILTVKISAHCRINLKSRTFKINGIEETHDMYSSINSVLKKLSARLEAQGEEIAGKRKPWTL